MAESEILKDVPGFPVGIPHADPVAAQGTSVTK